MKKIILALNFVPFFLLSCNKDGKNLEAPQKDSLAIAVTSIATISDFKTAADVDSVLDVPFSVYSKKDSVSLYVNPDLSSKYFKIENNKLNNYYGFDELDDFFVIHYQLQNDPRKTVVAYVSKKEFEKDSQLSLATVDINQIRSSAKNDVDDFKTKSFTKFGKVSLITKNVYLQGKNNISKGLIKPNPKMKFDGVSWRMDSYDEPFVVMKHTQNSESDFENEYVGFCARINREIFVEKDNLNKNSYYVGFDVYDRSKETVYFNGFPTLLPTERKVATINTSSDVGSDFSIISYSSEQNDFTNDLYVNFTNFKIVDSKTLFWVDKNVLYFQAVHTNTNTSGIDYKIEYLKIELN